MGYTHYISRPQIIDEQAWSKITIDTMKVLLYIEKELGIIIAGGDGEDEPEIGFDEIWFNGSGELSFETVYLERQTVKTMVDEENNNGLCWQFCKTANRPYDIAVTALYTIIKHHVPECIVESDGKEKDWMDAITICHDLLGYDLTSPLKAK
jgi:hypothetical protein